MADERPGNIRLGFFVAIGTIFLVGALYLIGNKQNLFGSTFSVSSQFYNVNGLMKGNNVRFAGIDVGTVKSVEIVSDSTVNVVMIIEKNVQKYIKKNAVASVGTDGLMGNKLVNINSAETPAPGIEEGDRLASIHPVEMDEMVRTLDVTNENIKVITTNLRNITNKLNGKNSLWSVLMDTIVAENVKSSIVNIKLMSNQGLMITGDLKNITNGVKTGKGSLGALVTDTTLSGRINQLVVKFNKISDTAAVLSGNLSSLTKKIKEGKGAVGILLNDTMLIRNLNTSMENLKTGSGGFSENMEALKYSWPFKKYYRKHKNKK